MWSLSLSCQMLTSVCFMLVVNVRFFILLIRYNNTLLTSNISWKCDESCFMLTTYMKGWDDRVWSQPIVLGVVLCSKGREKSPTLAYKVLSCSKGATKKNHTYSMYVKNI